MSYSSYKPSEEETNALRRRVLARMLAIYSEVNEWIENSETETTDTGLYPEVKTILRTIQAGRDEESTITSELEEKHGKEYVDFHCNISWMMISCIIGMIIGGKTGLRDVDADNLAPYHLHVDIIISYTLACDILKHEAEWEHIREAIETEDLTASKYYASESLKTLNFAFEGTTNG